MDLKKLRRALDVELSEMQKSLRDSKNFQFNIGNLTAIVEKIVVIEDGKFQFSFSIEFEGRIEEDLPKDFRLAEEVRREIR